MRVEFCRSLLALLSFMAVAVVISAQAADDDGRGLTFEDTTQGECRERSRLDAAAGNELAVVRIDGEWQLITADPVSGAAGVDAAQSVSPVVFFAQW